MANVQILSADAINQLRQDVQAHIKNNSIHANTVGFDVCGNKKLIADALALIAAAVPLWLGGKLTGQIIQAVGDAVLDILCPKK
ncbi:hypothetical protein ISN76_10225 [Dyella halodurans]|uniref:Uncharacterized protein n=1 Tax=Dyella halodurans TaxID=1920171 RepID=A0ABV9C222_9GAMM|nr:hypothetical protein [Dyella halodurans]